ncbi:MAG: tetraacyldisaccharide 4'-kinase [candidate division Zixibacteria bacterium]
MKRFWEIIIDSRGSDRFYCFPFLILFRIITPIYRFFSGLNLSKRKKRCSREWEARIISVGNISVGGTGKTPIVIWLARYFLERGKKVAIVHSGYGRSSDDNIIIGPGVSDRINYKAVGDETAMMATHLPDAGFAVGRDKKKMVRLADEKLSPDIIIIDDGYQRLDVQKDLDLVILPVGIFNNNSKIAKRTYRMFPSGRLREPLDSISRADGIMFVQSGDKDIDNSIQRYRDFNIKAPCLIWEFSLEGVTLDNRQVTLSELKNRKPFLFAGIGSFSRLITMLAECEVELAGSYSFGDHYNYDKLDFSHLRDLSNSCGADCYLTTAKDMVKLPLEGLDNPIYTLALNVEPADEAILNNILSRVDNEK